MYVYVCIHLYTEISYYAAFNSWSCDEIRFVCQAFIKTYCVDSQKRRAFRSVLTAFEFLSGLHRDGGAVPGALPERIRKLKERVPPRQPRFLPEQKFELM